MKCPECIEKGWRSTVQSHGGSTTLMYSAPYWDEDGVYHSHDMNTTTWSYSCSGGHRWQESVRPTCPAEDYP